MADEEPAAADTEPPEQEEPIEPTDIPGIGPATAEVIEAAPFDAADIVGGIVSYRMLLDAGVNAGVAARLRREYSLVWSFRWHVGGDDLPKRADQIRNLHDPERSWISESPGGPSVDGDVIAAWREWVDGAGSDEPPTVCPRCGSELARFTLEGHVRVQCESCGYVAVDIVRDRRPRPPESWDEAIRRFYARRRDADDGDGGGE